MPSRELPDRPDLEQYRKQAKDLLKDYRAGVAESRRRVTAHHPRFAAEHSERRFALADAQMVIAREHGIESWPKFVRQIEEASGRSSPRAVWRAGARAVVQGDVEALEALLRDYGEMLRGEQLESPWHNTLRPDYRAGDARAIIASTHHFKTWDEFLGHREAVRDSGSPVARFEAAVNAVVAGDAITLVALLRQDPQLVTARSTRKHKATLLHYVGANGVEAFRQHTPANAPGIATLLVDNGAEVDAVADMYGGSTTLSLVATSLHPKRAGVQQEILDLLINRGARVDHPATASSTGVSLVHSCLANGRPEAGAHLVRRGAAVDLVAAAGIGRLDLVESFADRHPRDDAAMRTEVQAALVMASTYGHAGVAEFLLDRGVDVDVVVDGFTGLNAAATQGHLEVVRLFLARGASPNIGNSFGGTALGASLWGAVNRGDEADYVPVIEAVLAAGVVVERELVEWWREQVQPPDVHARILDALNRQLEQ